MNVRSSLSIGVFVILGSVAMSGSSPSPWLAERAPLPDGSLVTNATSYVAIRIPGTSRPRRYQFTVITRFENQSTAPVFLARCFPNSPQPEYDIVAGDGSSVESAYSPVWACVGHNSQFQVPPGAVRIDTFRVQGPNMFDAGKQVAIGATAGQFKLILFIANEPGDGARRVAREFGLSNAFTVRTSD